ncbi:Rpr2-domain-containing protein [Hypoxylon sp. NC1633]|nr:Rpr2-domain-containing protein [Hypoxylon sp. NC1633]
MGKPREPESVPDRLMYSRASYLYQAAAYMTNLSDSDSSEPVTQGNEDATPQEKQTSSTAHSKQALARRFITDLKSATLKSRIRLSPAMKRTICKFCDSLLVEGKTSSSWVENQSKGGKKPWADVLVVKCHACSGVKRFPVQAPRQKRRLMREPKDKEKQEQEADATMVGD